jgi:hypothetical protein
MNPRRETGATFVSPTTSDVMVVSKLISLSFLLPAMVPPGATHSPIVAGETQITSLRACSLQACMSRIEMMPRAGDRPRARPRASFPDLIVCPI